MYTINLEPGCAAPLVYSACGRSEPLSCEALRHGASLSSSTECIEGCFCPEGTVLSETGDCVAPETCQCEQDGVMYDDGDVVLVDDCYLW